MKLRIKSKIRSIKKRNTTQYKKKKKQLKNEDSVRSLWDNLKRSYIYIIRVPEGEEKE